MTPFYEVLLAHPVKILTSRCFKNNLSGNCCQNPWKIAFGSENKKIPGKIILANGYNTRFFRKQLFYKQQHAEINKIFSKS